MPRKGEDLAVLLEIASRVTLSTILILDRKSLSLGFNILEIVFFCFPTCSCRILISSVSFCILSSCSSLLTHQLLLNFELFKTWSTPWLLPRGNHFQSQSLRGSGTRALSPGICSLILKIIPSLPVILYLDILKLVLRNTLEYFILHPGLVFYPKEQEPPLNTSKCSLSGKVRLVC